MTEKTSITKSDEVTTTAADLRKLAEGALLREEDSAARAAREYWEGELEKACRKAAEAGERHTTTRPLDQKVALALEKLLESKGFAVGFQNVYTTAAEAVWLDNRVSTFDQLWKAVFPPESGTRRYTKKICTLTVRW